MKKVCLNHDVIFFSKKDRTLQKKTHRCNAFPKPAALISFLGFPLRDVP